MKYVGFMKWNLYNKDNPNTWPQIDCPMIISLYDPSDKLNLRIWTWDNKKNCFIKENQFKFFTDECYYAYIGYVPSGYKTLYPVICTCESCPEGYDDNGYCMDYDNDCACGCKKEIAEYSIEEKRIWKEFE